MPYPLKGFRQLKYAVDVALDSRVVQITNNLMLKKYLTNGGDNGGSKDDSVGPVPIVERLAARYCDPLTCSIRHHLRPRHRKKVEILLE